MHLELCEAESAVDVGAGVADISVEEDVHDAGRVVHDRGVAQLAGALSKQWHS